MPYPAYEEVELPLLKLLFEKGGDNHQMRASDVYEPLADYFGLTDVERSQTRNELFNDGRVESVWHNRVQWARRKLNDNSYLQESSRGVWRLSELGVSRAKALATGLFSHVVYPGEEAGNTEGAVQQVSVNRYERSRTARQACINFYGYKCKVCSLAFDTQYGERGKHFIHVHHIVPLASVGASYVVNPVEDLRPVCPNCHAMLHRTNPPCSIEELRALISENDSHVESEAE